MSIRYSLLVFAAMACIFNPNTLPGVSATGGSKPPPRSSQQQATPAAQSPPVTQGPPTISSAPVPQGPQAASLTGLGQLLANGQRDRASFQAGLAQRLKSIAAKPRAPNPYPTGLAFQSLNDIRTYDVNGPQPPVPSSASEVLQQVEEMMSARSTWAMIGAEPASDDLALVTARTWLRAHVSDYPMFNYVADMLNPVHFDVTVNQMEQDALIQNLMKIIENGHVKLPVNSQENVGDAQELFSSLEKNGKQLPNPSGGARCTIQSLLISLAHHPSLSALPAGNETRPVAINAIQANGKGKTNVADAAVAKIIA